MNKLKNKLTIAFFGLLVLVSFSSCDEGGEPDPGGTLVQKYAGDWWISAVDTDGATVFEHVKHTTYNTAANDNTMWIDDHNDGYWIKAKVTVDVENGTFTATDADNVGDPGSLVTITNGKIEEGAALSQAGHVVDKISFTAHFDYDSDGYNIIYEGHKRTGFLEDEY
ncbi:lipid-binding protein [Flavobacterium sp.]